MNRPAIAAVLGGALVAVAVGTAGAATAAPPTTGSAQDAMNTLKSRGYTVVLNKVGWGPLYDCTVDSVRPGAAIVRPVHVGGEVVNQVVYRTVYLTAKC